MPPKKGRNLGADPRVSDVIQQLGGGYRTIGQMVYDVIKEMIQNGALTPGEWLRQESLATAIGVSRLPVRSALLQLEAEGLVTFHPHRGARVRSLTTAQVDEIYRMRCVLETYALRLSMAQMTPERLARLRTRGAQLDDKAEGAELVEVRVQFYRDLYDEEHNPLLVQIIEQLRASVGRYLLSFKFHSHTQRAHSDLVEKVVNNDLMGAEAWVYEHLSGVRQGIQTMITEEQTEAAAVAGVEQEEATV